MDPFEKQGWEGFYKLIYASNIKKVASRECSPRFIFAKQDNVHMMPSEQGPKGKKSAF
jgi:hypothetical protein